MSKRFLVLSMLLLLALPCVPMPAGATKDSDDYDQPADKLETAPPVKNKFTGESENEYEDGYKPISGNQSMQSGNSTSKSLMLQAQTALGAGNVDTAIQLIRKSLSENNDDADAHTVYAEALEKKMRSQTERDPELFNKVVKEWLIVMRDEVGDEKAMNFHGAGIGDFYRDEEHNLLAARHLTKLTGSAPKPWQTNARYLKKVLKPTDTDVKGVIVKRKDTTLPTDDQKDPDVVQQTKKDKQIVQKRNLDLDMDK
jgi:hypothetical protein